MIYDLQHYLQVCLNAYSYLSAGKPLPPLPAYSNPGRSYQYRAHSITNTATIQINCLKMPFTRWQV